MLGNARYKIFDILITAGYSIIGISGLVGALKAASKHDYENVVKAVIYTGISFAGLLLIPIILNMIRGVFG
jgi:hypothetical protein